MIRPRQLLGLQTFFDRMHNVVYNLYQSRNWYKRKTESQKKDLVKYGHFGYNLDESQSASPQNINRSLNVIDKNVVRQQGRMSNNINLRALYCLKSIKKHKYIKSLVYDYLKPTFMDEQRHANYLIDNDFKRNMGIAIQTALRGIPTRAYNAVVQGVCILC